MDNRSTVLTGMDQSTGGLRASKNKSGTYPTSRKDGQLLPLSKIPRWRNQPLPLNIGKQWGATSPTITTKENLQKINSTLPTREQEEVPAPKAKSNLRENLMGQQHQLEESTTTTRCPSAH